jgi:hypothetical protein
MKVTSVVSLCLGFASAATAATAVSYDGYKVVRVAVGDNVAKLNGIIAKLGLDTWKGRPKAGSFADIVVPPNQIPAFDAETSEMDVTIMHPDLGASIAAESDFAIYAGRYIIFEYLFFILMLSENNSRECKLLVVQVISRLRRPPSVPEGSPSIIPLKLRSSCRGKVSQRQLNHRNPHLRQLWKGR